MELICAIGVFLDVTSVLSTWRMIQRVGRRSGQPMKGGATMLRWALIFFVVAIVAAVFGFGGIAAGAAEIAKILFFIFLVVFVIMLIMGLVGRGRTPPV